MAVSFDRGVWLARVTKAARGNLTQLDLKYVNALEAIIKWCESRGLSVTFSKKSGGVYYTDQKEITINARAAAKQQLFLLLHECGHHLIGSAERHERYGMGYSTSDRTVRRTYHHRIDILEEEFEAWYRGWKLALRLGVLSLEDKVIYDKVRIRYLRSYLLWASKAPGYEKYDEPFQENVNDEQNQIVD